MNSHRVKGKSGSSSRIFARNVGILLVLTSTFVFLLACYAYYMKKPLVAFLAFCLFLAFARLTDKSLRLLKLTYLLGAQGESKVCRFLDEKLPPDYYIFNDIKTGNGNIDHIVIGPNGIFIIETKNYSGCVRVENNKVFIDGNKMSKDPFRQVRFEAYQVKKYLEKELKQVRFFVEPIVVFLNSEIIVQASSNRVAVLPLALLPDYILNTDVMNLPPNLVERLARSLGKLSINI